MINNRFTDILRHLPPATLSIISICVFFYTIQVTMMWDLQLFTMCPRLVLFTNEYYRIFTSVFFHANFMHIGMNMLSTSTISSALEKRIGTIRLIFSIWWSIILTSTVYVTIAYTAYIIFGYDTWMYQHSLGFSGIIFHLCVLENYLHPGTRSIFGFFSVPSFVYPWVLLLVLQLIMPNLSFLGHLAGIITGTLEYYGVLDGLYLGDSFLIGLELLPIMRGLVSLDSFVAASQSRGSVRQLRAESSLSHSIHKISRIIFNFFRDVLETIVVCICGRNNRFNSNIFRFWERQHPNNSNSNSNNNDINIECGIIRPVEFYEDGSDEEDFGQNSATPEIIVSQEREPILSRIV
mmetsp:Transcript_16299/g.18285  ORF Transcript_16299/g.18285 Transcript_16299/m.18285 type:complete len:350 (-) Transcript_16299:279-1328(-)